MKAIKTIKLWNGSQFTTLCVWNHLGVHCPDLPAGSRWFGWGQVQNSLDFS